MDIDDQVNIVDMIADEFEKLVKGIYEDVRVLSSQQNPTVRWPLRVSSDLSEKGSRADACSDVWGISVIANGDWCHSNPEPTSNRIGRLLIDHERIRVGRLGTQYAIALAEPRLEQEVLTVLHEDITSYLLGQAEVMERNGNLCRTSIRTRDVDDCYKAVGLLDLRYLAHMYKSAYLGWESIPDLVVVGSERDYGAPPVDRRPYRREQIEHEMHDPGRWKGH